MSENYNIITKGNFKKLAQLYAESIFAQNFPAVKTEALLSEQDTTAVWSQLRTEEQIQQLSQYNDFTRRIIMYCRYVHELHQKLIADINILYGYTLLLDAYIVEGEMISEIMDAVRMHSNGSDFLYNKVRDIIMNSNPPFVKYERNEETGAAINIVSSHHEKEGFDLYASIVKGIRTAHHTTILAKSAIEGIKKAMDDDGLKLKTAREFVKMLDARLKDKWAVIPPHLNDILKHIRMRRGIATPSRIIICPTYNQIEANPEEVESIAAELKGVKKGIKHGQ